MFLHKNTVKYRLQRIADRLGFVPGELPESMPLFTACALGRLLRGNLSAVCGLSSRSLFCSFGQMEAVFFCFADKYFRGGLRYNFLILFPRRRIHKEEGFMSQKNSGFEIKAEQPAKLAEHRHGVGGRHDLRALPDDRRRIGGRRPKLRTDHRVHPAGITA